MTLKNKTLFITGASRGIGREIALRAARDGANIIVAAKSATAHPKLPGTIYTVAAEIEALGGKALPLQLDVRDQDAVAAAVKQAAEHFDGIDILVNNAGAIRLEGVEHLDSTRFDLMYQINTRAVMVCSQAVLPYLKQSQNGHILNLSPPLNLSPKWFAQYAAYTITKYGMSMLTLGMSEEFAHYGISVNSLWPRTIIATAAIEHSFGDQLLLSRARKPSIMADAAYAIFCKTQRALTGQLLIDEDVLTAEGIIDFGHYRQEQNDEALMLDLFVEEQQ